MKKFKKPKPNGNSNSHQNSSKSPAKKGRKELLAANITTTKKPEFISVFAAALSYLNLKQSSIPVPVGQVSTLPLAKKMSSVSRITPCSCAARRYCVLSVTLISVTYLTTGPNRPVSVTA